MHFLQNPAARPFNESLNFRHIRPQACFFRHLLCTPERHLQRRSQARQPDSVGNHLLAFKNRRHQAQLVIDQNKL